MVSAATRKPGRPPKFVRDADGKEIHGLSAQPVKDGNGRTVASRFYATFSTPRQWFGRDFNLAILRFREWGREASVLPEHQWTAEGWHAKQERFARERGNPILTYDMEVIRAFIPANPQDAADKLRIPELSRLGALPLPEPSLPLAECLAFYCGKMKQPSAEEVKKVKAYWTAFVTATNPAKALADISDQHIDRWARSIFKGKSSAKLIRHKIDRVARVLRYCRTRQGKDKSNCQRLLDAIATIELPELPDVAPRPISRDDYHAMLKAAQGTQWHPMLLLMLNGCYYPCDARRLPVSAVDFKAGTIYLSARRNGLHGWRCCGIGQPWRYRIG